MLESILFQKRLGSIGAGEGTLTPGLSSYLEKLFKAKGRVRIGCQQEGIGIHP
jgi:hypothetical protein